MASRKNGTLYTGITNNLLRRVLEHKCGIYEGFTKKYCVNKLVYFESGENVYQAIHREKQLKKWNRKWKIYLIEAQNPDWKDLFDSIKG